MRSQRAYCVMYANSMTWQGVKHRSDVPRLSRERQQWLAAAVRAGAFLIASIGSGGQAKDSEYANHSFHAGIIATARYVIRMIELLPDACDLYEVSLDLDKLLLKLPYCKLRLLEGTRENSAAVTSTYSELTSDPSHPFTGILRRAVERAREQGVLPTTTISAEANASAAALPAAPPPPDVPPDGFLDKFLTGFNPLPWNAMDTGAGQPVAQKLDPDPMAGAAWPEVGGWTGNIRPCGVGADGRTSLFWETGSRGSIMMVSRCEDARVIRRS